MRLKRFDLGQIVQTSGVYEKISKDINFFLYVNECLNRYIKCDWGEMCDEDKEMNDLAVETEGRILASYESKDMPKIYIITEWDRSVTTILFPSEY
jgi:hypothetical protein